jgi:hypothetical protein
MKMLFFLSLFFNAVFTISYAQTQFEIDYQKKFDHFKMATSTKVMAKRLSELETFCLMEVKKIYEQKKMSYGDWEKTLNLKDQELRTKHFTPQAGSLAQIEFLVEKNEFIKEQIKNINSK